MGPLSNPSLEAYQKRVQELTYEANILRYQINKLKGKYSSSCSSYNHVADELEKSGQQETSMGNTSEEFDQEMLKVRDVIIKHGWELGGRKAQDLSLSMVGDGGLTDLDPSMMEKIT
ncbi:hypothetical protein Tco_0949678 [Tanacetum coccineum]